MEKLRDLLKNGYFIKKNFESKEEFFAEAARVLKADSVVTEGFHNAILRREENFPTGLLTLSIPVAIPHTEYEFVNKESILFCNFEKPISFKRMDDPNETVSAELAIMLLIKDKNHHMESLVELMGLIQSDQLPALKNATTYEECLKIISEV